MENAQAAQAEKAAEAVPVAGIDKQELDRLLENGYARVHVRRQGVFWSGWRDLKSRSLDPQTSAALCADVSRRPTFLKIRILHSGVFRWNTPNGGQNGSQTHSQAKRRLRWDAVRCKKKV